MALGALQGREGRDITILRFKAVQAWAVHLEKLEINVSGHVQTSGQKALGQEAVHYFSLQRRGDLDVDMAATIKECNFPNRAASPKDNIQQNPNLGFENRC